MTDAPDDMEDMTIGGMLRSQRGQYDDLAKAADALAEAAADVDKSRGKVWALEAHDRMMIALTAYRKAKEKMNAKV